MLPNDEDIYNDDDDDDDDEDEDEDDDDNDVRSIRVKKKIH